MLFKKLANGPLVFVGDYESAEEFDFNVMDDVKEKLASMPWTEVETEILALNFNNK
jgi:hypothetical protein